MKCRALLFFSRRRWEEWKSLGAEVDRQNKDEIKRKAFDPDSLWDDAFGDAQDAAIGWM